MIINDAIEMAQKLNGINILFAAVTVGDPFTLLA